MEGVFDNFIGTEYVSSSHLPLVMQCIWTARNRTHISREQRRHASANLPIKKTAALGEHIYMTSLVTHTQPIIAPIFYTHTYNIYSTRISFASGLGSPRPGRDMD